MLSTTCSETILDELTIVEQMRAGVAEGFEACVRSHCTRLSAVARRILRNEEDTLEVVQEAFLAAFRQLHRFEGRSQLATWLHRILVNEALGRLRARERHPERPIEEFLPHFRDGEHQIEAPKAWNIAPETVVQDQETRDLVHRCINELPDTYRIVLLLRDIEELDTEETARVLGTSAGVVKTRLHRARQALRCLLDPHFRKGNV